MNDYIHDPPRVPDEPTPCCSCPDHNQARCAICQILALGEDGAETDHVAVSRVIAEIEEHDREHEEHARGAFYQGLESLPPLSSYRATGGRVRCIFHQKEARVPKKRTVQVGGHSV